MKSKSSFVFFGINKKTKRMKALPKAWVDKPCKTCGKEPRRNGSAYGVKCARSYKKNKKAIAKFAV
jgi:hypothetical protein